MYGYGTITQSETNGAMQALRDKGVVKVLIEFSGGNDEGGADVAEYLDAEGKPVEMPTSGAGERNVWDQATKSYVNEGWQVYERTDKGYRPRPATDDEIAIAKVSKVLEAPIYDRWGSFAGEFYVHGTLEWDVATGKHKLTGQESVEHYEDFEDGDWDE